MITLEPIPLNPTPAIAWIAGFILAAKHANPDLTDDHIIEDAAAHRLMPRSQKKTLKEIDSMRNIAKGKTYGSLSLGCKKI